MRRAAVALMAIVTAGSCGGGGEGRESRATQGTVLSAATTTTVGPSSTTTAVTTAVTAPPTTAPAVPRTTTPPPADSAALAAELVRLETAIRDPATAADRLPGLAQSQQVAYRALAARRDQVPAVLSAVPPSLRATVEANTTARLELGSLAPRRSEPPPWKVRAPAPAAELLGYYREAEAASGVPWQYLAAINLVETYMGRIRSASTAGAQGPMQFIPSTWAEYGRGDINNDRDAILAAGRLLRAGGAPNRMAAALYRYNPSNHYVRAVTAYAGQMAAHERAYLAYHQWQVMVSLTTGDMILPEGFGA